MRKAFYFYGTIFVLAVIGLGFHWPPFWFSLILIGPLYLLGLHDVIQTKRIILRNFPVLGHGRYLLEAIRPELNQYFVESNTDGTPFSREQRSVVYQRAKRELDTLAFGTQHDVYAPGYEWVEHSLVPAEKLEQEPRVTIGADRCAKPYSSSLLNISAMSFGSLSRNAVLSLGGGAKRGGFAINTGEGGLSPHHLETGADIIWQIGTAYFGARDMSGHFDPVKFRDVAAHEQVRMIEIKLSQGAKPGHGGILPAAKVTPEIAKIRGVPLGQDVISPPGHSAFSTPIELLEFVTQLRELSGGKPVGFKLCIGRWSEFIAICKAMVETGLRPDYIAVDGGEGGTGAAPLEFSNSVGTPLMEALVLVHNSLVGFDLRKEVIVMASGKIAAAFQMVSRMALGADICYSARAMMMAAGCIQARRCNANDCPVGIATQNPDLSAGIHVPSRAARVHRYHEETIDAFLELLSAAGLDHPSQLSPDRIRRRTSAHRVQTYDEIFSYIDPGSLVAEPVPESLERYWHLAHADKF